MKVTQSQLNNMDMLLVKEWDTWCWCQAAARIYRKFYMVTTFNA